MVKGSVLLPWFQILLVCILLGEVTMRTRLVSFHSVTSWQCLGASVPSQGCGEVGIDPWTYFLVLALRLRLNLLLIRWISQGPSKTTGPSWGKSVLFSNITEAWPRQKSHWIMTDPTSCCWHGLNQLVLLVSKVTLGVKSETHIHVSDSLTMSTPFEWTHWE